jgi:hypothetical protein
VRYSSPLPFSMHTPIKNELARIRFACHGIIHHRTNLLLTRRTKNEAAKAEAFAKRKRDSDEKEKWESGMGGRIDGWRDFKKPKKKKKGSAGLGFLKPPKLKTEKRDTTSKR